MSAGGRLSAVAELGLWVAAAALIASTAGMRLPGDVLARSAATPTPSPGAVAVASGSPSPSATSAPAPSIVPTPSPVPTLSPLVRKFQAYLARKDFQFQATGTGSQSASGLNLSVDLALTGSMSYRAGSESNSTKMTSNGQTVTNDTIYSGTNKYERSNGGPWIKKPRTATDSAVLFSPKRLFVDTGVETKNGAALHRLEVADPAALSAEVDALGIVTNTHVTLVFWTRADGTPAAFRMEGTWDEQVAGVTAHVTAAEDYAITRLSGVTISAPKSTWQWIVDDLDKVGFGLPPNWSKQNYNRDLGLTTYLGPNGQLDYETLDAGGQTLDQIVDGATTGVDPAEGRRALTVGGVSAVSYGQHRSKQQDYVRVTLFLRGSRVYGFLVFGQKGQEATADSLAAQILSTVEFTK